MKDNNIPSFFNKLNPMFKKAVENLINKKRALFIYRISKWVCWIIALLILLINFNSFNNNTEMLKSIFLFCIAGLLVFTAGEILKVPKNDF